MSQTVGDFDVSGEVSGGVDRSLEEGGNYNCGTAGFGNSTEYFILFLTSTQRSLTPHLSCPLASPRLQPRTDGLPAQYPPVLGITILLSFFIYLKKDDFPTSIPLPSTLLPCSLAGTVPTVKPSLMPSALAISRAHTFRCYLASAYASLFVAPMPPSLPLGTLRTHALCKRQGCRWRGGLQWEVGKNFIFLKKIDLDRPI